MGLNTPPYFKGSNMSVIMYKKSGGEIIEECVRPVGYQAKLKDGWVVNPDDLEKIPEKKPLKKKK